MHSMPRTNVEPFPVPVVTAVRERATAVDALRGLAVLGMVLVSTEPYGVLPAWMYHAQEPPPTHAVNTAIAGLTWPDLVFPIFLFTLGAAIPLALAPRLAAGAGYLPIFGGVLWRGALLVFFALFRQHFEPSVSGYEPARTAWMLALAGFIVLCLVLTRLPERWGRGRRIAVRGTGWIAAGLMLALVRFPDGSTFTPERIDLVIVLLAYSAVFGTLIWLVTRHSVLARLAALAIIVTLRLTAYSPGWLHSFQLYEPLPWLYKFAHFQYLCAALPGTIVGDLLVRWMTPARGPAPPPRAASWTHARLGALAATLLASIPVVLVGIQGRHVFLTTVAAAGLCLAASRLARRPETPAESLVVQLVHWGTFWLLIGLLLEPLDGGTKKIPPTFSWFFIGSGLAVFLTAIFVMVANIARKERWLALLADNGRNPMIAYVGYGMLILPLLGLSGIRAAIDRSGLTPWVYFGWSVLVMLMVALTVRAFTRRQLYWRT